MAQNDRPGIPVEGFTLQRTLHDDTAFQTIANFSWDTHAPRIVACGVSPQGHGAVVGWNLEVEGPAYLLSANSKEQRWSNAAFFDSDTIVATTQTEIWRWPIGHNVDHYRVLPQTPIDRSDIGTAPVLCLLQHDELALGFTHGHVHLYRYVDRESGPRSGYHTYQKAAFDRSIDWEHLEIQTLSAVGESNALIAAGRREGQTVIEMRSVRSGEVLCRILPPNDRAIKKPVVNHSARTVLMGGADGNIRVWGLDNGTLLNVIEGHTAEIYSIALSADGKLVVTESADGSIRIWFYGSWETLATTHEEQSKSTNLVSLEFHPSLPNLLARKTTDGSRIQVWRLDSEALVKNSQESRKIFYTTAKIALVGDSGVGKTALGYRLAKGEFRESTKSTHGQQFWVVDELGMTREDGTICEAVLWDFAGQPSYRPIHTLFLDDVDIALLVFDPSRRDSYASIEYWLKQLSRENRVCPTILVAARSDVSGLIIAPSEIAAYCVEHGIQGWVMTSASTGAGIGQLLEKIREVIPWGTKPTIVSTDVFKRIKDHVLAVKEKYLERAEQKHDSQYSAEVLLSIVELEQQLNIRDVEQPVSKVELMTAVEHLQNHGYITILRRSSDEQSILLTPDLFINLAASFMLKAQGNDRGLGSLDEAKALSNEYDFIELEELNQSERDVLLTAVTKLFLDKNVCFRESIDGTTYLIFPALILERPPQMIEDADLTEDTTYIVSGSVENVYAALVVLLGYSPTFKRTNQWHKQAEYETVRGEICSFKQTNEGRGSIELVIHYKPDTSESTRMRFQGLFEEILYSRRVVIQKYAPLFCLNGHQQDRTTVIKFIREKDYRMYCPKCGVIVQLPQQIVRRELSREMRSDVTTDQKFARLKTVYESALVSIKGVMIDRSPVRAPICFISYAWGTIVHDRWVERLATDLQNAGVSVTLDRWESLADGTNIARFIERITDSDFVIVVATLLYKMKYRNADPEHGTIVAAEMDLINQRLTGTQRERASILPLLRDGSPEGAFPPLMLGLVYADFRSELWYFAKLFDLLLTIFQISFNDPAISDLRDQLRAAAEGSDLY